MKEYNLNPQKNATKNELLKLIDRSNITYYDIGCKFPKYFGIHPSEVENLLGINKTIRKKLIAAGVLKISFTKYIKIHGRGVNVQYTSLESLYKLSKERLDKFIDNNYRKPTKKQIEGYKRGIDTRNIKKEQSKLNSRLDELIKEKEEIIEILENPNNIIIDVASSGLTINSKVLEVAIISMSGDIILNSLVNPNKDFILAEEARNLHKITRSDLETAPMLNELGITSLINNKNLYSYSPGTDLMFLEASKLDNIENIFIHSIMDIVSSYLMTNAISLNRAVYELCGISKAQSYRALDDALDALSLLNAISKDIDERLDFINNEINKCKGKL